MAVSLLFGLVDALKGAGFDQWMPAWLAHLPLTEQGLAWLIPSVATLGLMVVVDRMLGKPSEALA
jgi:LIVCS family branched-chain amino acid:cation transporter